MNRFDMFKFRSARRAEMFLCQDLVMAMRKRNIPAEIMIIQQVCENGHGHRALIVDIVSAPESHHSFVAFSTVWPNRVVAVDYVIGDDYDDTIGGVEDVSRIAQRVIVKRSHVKRLYDELASHPLYTWMNHRLSVSDES